MLFKYSATELEIFRMKLVFATKVIIIIIIIIKK